MWNQDVPARVPEDVFSYSGSRFDGTTKLSSTTLACCHLSKDGLEGIPR